MTLFWLAVVTAAANAAVGAGTVSIDASTRLSRVLPAYASVDLDWWPADSQGSGGSWKNASALDIDLGSPRLAAFVGALGDASPAYLRIGGSMDTAVRYGGFFDGVDDDAYCRAPRIWRGANATLCLTAARYRKLHAFARDAGLEIVFGLSYPGVGGGVGDALGDSFAVPPYNGTQNRALLAYSKRMNLTLAAVELGEEMVPAPGSADFGRLLDAYRMLGRDVAAIYGDERPVVVGPCAGMGAETNDNPACEPTCGPSPFFQKFVEEALSKENKLIGALCVHSYDNDGSPGLLSQTKRQVEAILRTARAVDPDARVWCGECGPHNQGGVANVTDGPLDGFWYVDALGSLATLGVAEFGRQALVGSHYGLLDETFEPRPDFYVLLLWKRLMGPTVLRVDGGDATLRVFAHCADGAVGVAFVNVGAGARSLGVAYGARPVDAREEWHLAPRGRDLALNGRPLTTDGGAALPDLAGRVTTGPLSIGPRSYGFARFPGACPP